MKVWVAELDKVTCERCEAMDGMAIEDNETWGETAGVEPGDMHARCRCFEMWFPDDLPVDPTRAGAEDIMPQGLTESKYEYILPLGALILLWPEEEKPGGKPEERLRYMEDDYEQMMEWTMIWD